VNGTQAVITIGYSVLVVAALWITLRVIRSTRPEQQETEFDRRAWVRRETGWAWVVIAGLVVLLALTISSIPYWSTSEAKNTQRVNVTGIQFAWAMTPNVVRVDQPVEFRLRSKDVNHAFGLFRGHRLEVQVQVMPGREQRLVHTFHEKGTYTVLCMEFCGLDHDRMRSQLVVR
jgi:cytochrome c oxidase subunit 2